jgi:hypothetical protein
MSSYSTDTSNIFDVFTNNKIVTRASRSVDEIYETVSANRSLFIGLFAVVLITIVVATILYSYVGWYIFQKSENSIKETKIPIVANKLTRFVANIDKTGNGARRSISFWIYINDMNKYSGQYKNVLAVSNHGDDLIPDRCSPYIFLDNRNNSLYVRFSNRDLQNELSIVKNCASVGTDDSLADYMKQGIQINYIPLQRWVHVAVVCNADTYRTHIYAYVDGDLVNTVAHKDRFKLLKNSKISEKEAYLNDIDLNMSGYLYIGNNPTGKCGPGFSGLVSNFSIFNYELNPKDVYNLYNRGPITGFMATLGLGAYGVRNPIYKL